MNPINAPRSNEKLIIYGDSEIQKKASPNYQTHNSKLLSKVYKAAEVLTKPMERSAYWLLIGRRKGEGKGSRRGGGGVSKKFSTIKAMGWLGLTLVTLPLVILGLVTKSFILRPGRGRDIIRFMNATKKSAHPYIPPSLPKNEQVHLATFNVGGLPPIVDAIKDVRPAKERMKEFAQWINRQKEEDLPLGIGLQEAFDQNGSEIFTNNIKERYPYAVTSAGWANVPVMGSNSGIQFHSRVPIKSAAFYGFDDLDGFGVKCSDRGFLRVELDLGEGKSSLIYVTHTQPHSDPMHQKIRRNEIELIRNQMRYDRYQDNLKGIDRGGHYYLMGDLNVANVDDEHANDENGGLINEYNDLRKTGQVLNDATFFDPYLEEHESDGTRKEGEPIFLKKDVQNETRQKNAITDKKWKTIQEPVGSFYRGADQKNRQVGGYGTKNFFKGNHPTLANCRYDYVLQLQDSEDYIDPSTAPKFTGKAEIRHVLPEGSMTTAISDHLLISAIFHKTI